MILQHAGAVPQKRSSRDLASGTLSAAVAAWWLTVVAGQAIFATYVILFYSLSAVHGQLGDKTKFINHGYVQGDLAGNIAAAAHILFAIVINLSGAIQLLPQLRSRAPRFHRVNGRIFIFGAYVVAIGGLYMTWIRGTVGDNSQHVALTIDVVLIMLFAALSLRAAMARRIAEHRRWALRLFMVVSGSWFLRIGITCWVLINRSPVGFDTTTFTGPTLTIASFGEYLVPLAMLELYFLALRSSGGAGRIAMAAGLFATTCAMFAGLAVLVATSWLPAVATAYLNRDSIVRPLASTIASRGVDAAVVQYHRMHETQPGRYDFSENQLNALGYQLLQTKQFEAAERIFALNIEAYPKSGNVYDSLGEAYMDQGNTRMAIIDYTKSLAIDPQNANAVRRLAILRHS